MSKQSGSTNYFGSIKTLIFNRLGHAILTGAGVSLIAQGSVFLMHVILGRELGPNGYGVFSLVMGFAMLVAQLCPLGWQTIITRLISQYSTESAWGLLKGAIMRSNQITIFNSIIASIIVVALSHWVVIDQEIQYGLYLSSILIPFFAFKLLIRRQLVGLNKPKFGIFLDDAVAPLLMIATALTIGFGVAENVIASYAGLVILICVYGVFSVNNELPEQARGVKTEFKTKSWMSSALPATLALVSRIALNRIDILMIGPMIGVYEVGLYSTAQRLGYILLFMPMVIGTITSPLIASAWYKKDLQEVRRLFVVSTVISSIVAAVMVALLLPFSGILISFTFGEEFVDATVIFQVLLIGLFFQAVGGALSSTMMMTGQEKTFSFTITVIMIVNVLGNLIAIPVFGAVGAAAVTSSCTIVLSIWQFQKMNKHLSIFTLDKKHTSE
jgi:O-antigen/teichoic acid export membrane protein